MELRRLLIVYAAGLMVMALALSMPLTWTDGVMVPGKEAALVDVALQERIGQGDAEIAVLVVFKEGVRPDLDDLKTEHIYHIINGAALLASPAQIEDISKRDDLVGIYLDGKVAPAAPESGGKDQGKDESDLLCPSRAVNADELWDIGLDGTGVVVAVIDSGIDKNHPDLAGKVVGEVNFVDGEATTDDLLGHGTLVAGIIAGSGVASGGRYRGIAPGASLLNVRVIDSNGNGQVSDIIAGIEWAMDNGAVVLSLSLAGLNLGETNPPVTMAADNAMNSGAVVCVAAGNNG